VQDELNKREPAGGVQAPGPVVEEATQPVTAVAPTEVPDGVQK
jgi:hypothetical protein